MCPVSSPMAIGNRMPIEFRSAIQGVSLFLSKRTRVRQNVWNGFGAGSGSGGSAGWAGLPEEACMGPESICRLG